MKKDGKYRFTLQFGSDTDEEYRVGEFLEGLGNKKSSLIVTALNEYLTSHPELQNLCGKIEVKVSSNFNQEKIEQLIRTIVDEKLAILQSKGTIADVSSVGTTESLEDDVAKMLENLNCFE